MKKVNPAHVKTVLELINASPYFRLLGMQVTEMGIGYATIELSMSHELCNCFGGIHGGVYASLIDTATYWSAYCEVEEESGFTSIDISVNNLSSFHQGKIVVRAKSIKTGRSMCLAEATAVAEDGRLLAHGTSKMMVLKGRQSVQQLAADMGRRIPPKFLEEA